MKNADKYIWKKGDVRIVKGPPPPKKKELDNGPEESGRKP